VIVDMVKYSGCETCQVTEREGRGVSAEFWPRRTPLTILSKLQSYCRRRLTDLLLSKLYFVDSLEMRISLVIVTRNYFYVSTVFSTDTLTSILINVIPKLAYASIFQFW